MTTQLTIQYNPHLHQQAFHQSSARFRILACGRRWGKTIAACNEGIKLALRIPGSLGWIVSPQYSQTMISWRIMLRYLPKELIRNINRSERYIELINYSVIWFKSADNPDSLRGEGLHWLIIDEAALVKREAWEDSLRPALADKEGLAIFISTPKGHNWFFELYSRGQDPEYEDFESWRLPTSSSPFISREEIEEARRTLPERVFRQEFEAEFIDDIGSVFRNVSRCIEGILEGPGVGAAYRMGVDLAKYRDFTVIVVINETNHVVHFDRFSRLDWTFQKMRIAEAAKRFNDAHVTIDSTGVGDPIFEDLERSGINITDYKFTNESKKKLIENLSILIEQQQVTFPEIPELVNELKIFGYRQTDSGTIRYSAPDGYHDDCVIALALACTSNTVEFARLPRLSEFWGE